jgi:beta-barrel assembly-enhancing protease
MNRRDWLAGAAALGCSGLARAGTPSATFEAPPRFERPPISSDEGGFWALLDREEKRLRTSPLLLADDDLHAYVQEVACRLGGEHCPDIRVYLVRTPLFNASMAPNGMMQVWSGLLLRCDNEAQLAAVLGHEIGHYLRRHTMERVHDAKTRAGWLHFWAIFGAYGLVGQLATLAGQFSFTRDHEREADRIGAILMHKAGYDVREAARIWENLTREIVAKTGKEPSRTSPMFATHPAEPERQATLAQLAAMLPGGDAQEDRYARVVEPALPLFLRDEIKRAQFDETLTVLSRQIARGGALGPMYSARGEVFRLRNGTGDPDAALADYRRAIAEPAPMPEAYRGIGLIQRQRGDKREAADMLNHYLERFPEAPDAAFIQSYLAELQP